MRENSNISSLPLASTAIIVALLEGSLVATLLRAEVDRVVIHCPAMPARALAILRVAEARAVAFENGSIVAIIVTLEEVWQKSILRAHMERGEVHSGLVKNGGARSRRRGYIRERI